MFKTSDLIFHETHTPGLYLVKHNHAILGVARTIAEVHQLITQYHEWLAEEDTSRTIYWEAEPLTTN